MKPREDESDQRWDGGEWVLPGSQGQHSTPRKLDFEKTQITYYSWHE